MRINAPLDDLFHSGVAVRVLRTLSRFPTKEFTGRELARESHVAPSKAIGELNSLMRWGLVERRTAGRAQLWKLNARHVWAEKLRDLFQAEQRIWAGLEREIGAKLVDLPGLERVVVFGSTARGTATRESDVDVLIVVKSEAGKENVALEMQAVRTDLQKRYGRRFQPIIYSVPEWNRKKKLPLGRAIEKEGRVILGARR